MSYASNDRYREMDVMAMPPARRLVLLYTQLLVLLRQVRRHIERNEIELRCEKLMKAEAIVRELLISLDHQHDGDFAARLASLYRWWLGEFAATHRRPDLIRFDKAAAMVAQLHEAWQTAADQLDGRAEAPAA